MANEKHLLMTATGDYTDSGLASEAWMVTLRLCLVFGSPAPDIGTLPNDWDVVAQPVSRTESQWTISGNWKAVKGPSTFSPDDYLNDQAAPQWAAWMGAFPGLSSAARLRTIRLYPIGTNGRAIPAPPYAVGTPMELNWTSGYPVGSSSAQQLPLQIAGVVSHRTGQIGRRGRGRMFAPALTTAAVDHDSLFTSSWQNSAANVQKNSLAAWAFDATLPTERHVRPIITGAPWTQYAVITSVQAGNVPDTQRRRRRQLVETKVTQAVTY